MSPAGHTSLVAEYFCFRGDATWCASDRALVDATARELVRLGMLQRQQVLGGVVVRVPRAYPLFELGYTDYHRQIEDYLARFSNLHLIGRGGSFRYYNMDHAMESGMATAQRLLDKAVRGTELGWPHTGTSG